MAAHHGVWVVIASFFSHFLSLGVIYSGGVYVLPIAAEFGVGRGAASWVVSLWMGMMLAGCFLSGRLIDRLGARPVFSAGGIGTGLGLLALSFARSLGAAIACSTLVGLAMSCCGAHGASVVQPWFRARRGLATGLAMMGSGAGHFALTLTLQVLIDRWGWRVALRLEALVVAVGICTAATQMRRPTHAELAAVAGPPGPGADGGAVAGVGAGPGPGAGADAVSVGNGAGTAAVSTSGALKAASVLPAELVAVTAVNNSATTVALMHTPAATAAAAPTTTLWSLLETRAMRGVCGFKFVAAFGYGVPFVHTAPLARDSGLGEATAARLLAFMGLAGVCGRVALGVCADRHGRLRTYKLSMIALGATGLAWPFARAHGAMWAAVLVYGFFAGAYPSLHGTIIADFFAGTHGGFLFRLLGCSFSADTVGATLGPPIAGWLFDYQGHYEGSGAYAGAAVLCGVLCLFAVPLSAESHRRNLDTVLLRNANVESNRAAQRKPCDASS